MPTPNRLKRGADPYADAGETEARTGTIPFTYDNTRYAGAVAIQLIAPFTGWLSEIQAIVQTLTAGAGVVSLAINGASAFSTLAVPDAQAVGTKLKKTFPASALDASATNYVRKGDTITLTADATPTAGELNGFLVITPEPKTT